MSVHYHASNKAALCSAQTSCRPASNLRTKKTVKIIVCTHNDVQPQMQTPMSLAECGSASIERSLVLASSQEQRHGCYKDTQTQELRSSSKCGPQCNLDGWDSAQVAAATVEA